MFAIISELDSMLGNTMFLSLEVFDSLKKSDKMSDKKIKKTALAITKYQRGSLNIQGKY